MFMSPRQCIDIRMYTLSENKDLKLLKLLTVCIMCIKIMIFAYCFLLLELI